MNSMKRSYIVVSESWGVLVIKPTEATCGGWSEMFPYGTPVLFKTRKEAAAIAALWDPSMNVWTAVAPSAGAAR